MIRGSEEASSIIRNQFDQARHLFSPKKKRYVCIYIYINIISAHQPKPYLLDLYVYIYIYIYIHLVCFSVVTIHCLPWIG